MVIAGGVRVPQQTLVAHESELKAQCVHNILCNSGRLPTKVYGRVGEWLKPADCKSVL